MRKSELKVGEEYAVGTSSRFDHWGYIKGVVVDLDAQRQRRNGTVARGILVRFPDGGRYDYRQREPGSEALLKSARDIQCPWAPYAERKAEYDRHQGELMAERERVRNVGGEVQTRMAALGLPEVRFSNGEFHVSADKMAEIIARIPDGR